MPRAPLPPAPAGPAATLLAATLLLAACGRPAPELPGGATAPSPGPLRVTTTTGIIADTARRIAGDRAIVESLMGPGVDPHLYKPTGGDLARLSGARLVLWNGLHLEGKMTEVLSRISTRTRTVPVTDGIPRELLRQPPEFQGHYDPHVWFDVTLWMRCAETIRDALIEIDPAGEAAYRERAEGHLAELRDLDAWTRSRISAIPAERRVLVTAHDAFGYFGRAYGLEVVALQGISTATEFGLADLDRLAGLVASRRLPAVFLESSVPPSSIEALLRAVRSRGAETRIGGTLYSDALGAEGTPEGTYPGMVRANVRAIADALGAPPERP